MGKLPRCYRLFDLRGPLAKNKIGCMQSTVLATSGVQCPGDGEGGETAGRALQSFYHKGG